MEIVNQRVIYIIYYVILQCDQIFRQMGFCILQLMDNFKSYLLIAFQGWLPFLAL